MDVNDLQDESAIPVRMLLRVLPFLGPTDPQLDGTIVEVPYSRNPAGSGRHAGKASSLRFYCHLLSIEEKARKPPTELLFLFFLFPFFLLTRLF